MALVDVSEQEQEWARVAKEAFDSHRFENCLSVLNKLLDARRRDARIAHNRAVAQYMLSNLTHTDEFRKTLQSVSSQFSEESSVGGEEGVVSDTGVLLYNQALIHLKLHQNKQAAEILQCLFKARDCLNTPLAIDVCIMLIEVCITTYQLGVASSHIDFVEAKLFADSSRENGEFSAEMAEKYRTKLCSFRARLALLHGNIKNSKKEVKAYINMGGNTSSSSLLKANVEYLKQNYMKAMKVLGAPPKSPIVTDSGECVSAFYFNNLACLRFHLGRYHLGAYFLCKAIEENDSALNGFPPLDRAMPLSGRPLSVLGVNCRHILLYNLGLQQLFAGQPMAAFESLLEVVQVYHANPRLWFRLAEACIATHAKNTSSEESGKGRLVRAVIGKGRSRKVVAETLHTCRRRISDPHSAAMPAPTLEFSAVCLNNALFLLDSYTASSNVCPALPGPPMQGDAITSLRCYIMSSLSYVALGLGDPVSALAYSLRLRAMSRVPGGLLYLTSLYSAQALVLLHRVPEALKLLTPDNIKDINFTVVSEMESGTGEGDTSPTPAVATKVEGYLSDVQQSQAVMYCNLATTFCVLKDYDKAKQAMTKAAALFPCLPPELIQVAAYIQLAKGNAVQAVQILRRTQALVT